MKKILYIFALILTAGIFLPSCSDDKNEPDDPNKGTPSHSSLAEMVDGEKYKMEFPFKVTNSYDGKVEDSSIIEWNAGKKKGTSLLMCDNYWGKDDYYSIIIERTDGKKLETDWFGYIEIEKALTPRIDLYNYKQQDSLMFNSNSLHFYMGEIDKTKDRFEVKGLCIDKMSDYKYKITMKASLPDENGIRTRFAQVEFKDIYPTRVTSLDGKTEYRFPEDAVSGDMCISLGIYSIPPAGVQASGRRNVFLDDMGSGVIQKMKKVKRQ